MDSLDSHIIRIGTSKAKGVMCLNLNIIITTTIDKEIRIDTLLKEVIITIITRIIIKDRTLRTQRVDIKRNIRKKRTI